MLNEVEYLLDPCMSMQRHLCILPTVILLHLSIELGSKLAFSFMVHHEYLDSKGEFGHLLLDSTWPSSCPTL
jgi:hypothetical protein